MDSMSDDANIKEYSSDESNDFDLYTNESNRRDGYFLQKVWTTIDPYQLDKYLVVE